VHHVGVFSTVYKAVYLKFDMGINFKGSVIPRLTSFRTIVVGPN